MADFFKVERDEAGCEHCNHGGSWTVAWTQDGEAHQLDTSFDDKARAEELQVWMEGAYALGRDSGWLDHTKRVHPPALQVDGLPFPRLQLTWHRLDNERFLVTYDLVVRVKPGDIRDEGKLGYICRPMSGGTIVGTTSPFRDGNILDVPFRDNYHIHHDAQSLDVPAYVVYGGHSRRLEWLP